MTGYDCVLIRNGYFVLSRNSYLFANKILPANIDGIS